MPPVKQGFTLERDSRLSHSLLWGWARLFYETNGKLTGRKANRNVCLLFAKRTSFILSPTTQRRHPRLDGGNTANTDSNQLLCRSKVRKGGARTAQ